MFGKVLELSSCKEAPDEPRDSYSFLCSLKSLGSQRRLFEELGLSSAGERGRGEASPPDWGHISIQEEERHRFLTKQGHLASR